MFRLLFALVALSYPFIVYFGISYLSPTILALLLAVIALSRVFTSEVKRYWKFAALTLVVVLSVLHWYLRGGTHSLMFYPVVINWALFLAFSLSLFKKQSLIETIARERRMDVGPHNTGYLRVLTAIWAGFFAVSIIISTLTALSQNMSIWLLYNGVISYLAIAILILGELIFRHFYRQRLNRNS